MTKVIKSNLPASGVLEFDYVSTTKAPLDASPATDAQVALVPTSMIRWYWLKLDQSVVTFLS